MRLRRLLQVAVVSAALVSPLAAFAEITGSVTTAPYQPAPALTMGMLTALAIALTGLGAYRVCNRPAGAAAGFALVAGLSLLAGLSYASNGGISVKDADCNMRTTQSYPGIPGELLTSLCPNPIKIVAIDPGCGTPDPPPSPCTVGQILTNGQKCVLPTCL
jgi:hypothetical protein